LIDAKGHIKLADFGLSKGGILTSAEESPGFRKSKVRNEDQKRKGAYSVVGSPDYMAPEILTMSSEGYGTEVDWWSLGCLIFEMITGYPPFNGSTPHEVFENIRSWKTVLPKTIAYYRDYLSDQFLDLVLGLLCEPERRLGSDIEVIKRHPFFKGIEWDNLRNFTPLFVPKLENECDVSYFDRPEDPSSPLNRTNTFSRYYDSCLLKHKEKLSNPLRVQLERLHRSHSLDASELHAYNIPAWVTPYRSCKRSNDNQDQIVRTVKERTKPLHLITPPQEIPETPSSDKQILGFTFQRKQQTRVVHLDKQQLPTFKLTEAEAEAEIFEDELCMMDG